MSVEDVSFYGWTWNDECPVPKSISHIDSVRRSHSIPISTLNSVCLRQLLKFKTDIVNDSVELLLFGVPLKMTFVNDYYYDYIVSCKNKSLCVFRLILFVSDDCHRLVSICTSWTSKWRESLYRMQQVRQQSMIPIQWSIVFSTRALYPSIHR